MFCDQPLLMLDDGWFDDQLGWFESSLLMLY